MNDVNMHQDTIPASEYSSWCADKVPHVYIRHSTDSLPHTPYPLHMRSVRRKVSEGERERERAREREYLPTRARSIYVYYWSCKKAVCRAGGGEGDEGHVLKDTTSRGLCR